MPATFYKSSAKNARKRRLPTTALCRNRCGDHVVVSRSHKQQTKSQNISNQQTEILLICVTVNKSFCTFLRQKNLRKPMWQQSQPNAQNYTVAKVKNRVRKRWLTESIVRNWNLADTKLIKSFTRFTRIGFEKIYERRTQSRHTYDTQQTL